jgi:hypothetical protein
LPPTFVALDDDVEVDADVSVVAPLTDTMGLASPEAAATATAAARAPRRSAPISAPPANCRSGQGQGSRPKTAG